MMKTPVNDPFAFNKKHTNTPTDSKTSKQSTSGPMIIGNNRDKH